MYLYSVCVIYIVTSDYMTHPIKQKAFIENQADRRPSKKQTSHKKGKHCCICVKQVKQCNMTVEQIWHE